MCVYDKHPLAGRDIQYWAPDSLSWRLFWAILTPGTIYLHDFIEEGSYPNDDSNSGVYFIHSTQKWSFAFLKRVFLQHVIQHITAATSLQREIQLYFYVRYTKPPGKYRQKAEEPFQHL